MNKWQELMSKWEQHIEASTGLARVINWIVVWLAMMAVMFVIGAVCVLAVAAIKGVFSCKGIGSLFGGC